MSVARRSTSSRKRCTSSLMAAEMDNRMGLTLPLSCRPCQPAFGGR